MYVGSKVTVVLPDGVTSYTARVSRISHAITNRRWAVQVFLRNAEVIQRHRRNPKDTEVANNPDGMIRSAHLEDDAVTTAKIAPEAVTTSEIADGAVTAIKAAFSPGDIGAAEITYSTAAPTGTPGGDGDLWIRQDGSDNIIGMWVGAGGAWVAQQLKDDVIAELDAGKITTGILEGITIRGSLFETRAPTAGRARMTFLSETSTGDVDRITLETGRADEVSVGRLDVAPGTVGGLDPTLLLTPPSVATDATADPSLKLSPGKTGLGIGTFNGKAELGGRDVYIRASDTLYLYATTAIALTAKSGTTTPLLKGLDWKTQNITTDASGLAVVTHGLGVAPSAVFVISNAGSTVHNMSYRIHAVSSSAFTVEVWNSATNAADASATRPVMWLAIA
jgi:hypothetical protein